MELKKRLTTMFAVLLAVLCVLHLSCGRQSPPPKLDNTPPTVISLVPGNTHTNVFINAAISVTFSEPVDEKSIAFRLVALKVGGSVLVPCTMSYSGTTAVFMPDQDLEYITSYSAWVGSGVRDLDGNAMINETTWSFTTGQNPDTTPPRVVDIQPSRGKTGVSTNSAISVMFSESMDPTTVLSGMQLSNLNGSIGGAVSYNGATATATFTPNYNLSTNKEYTVTVTTGVKDLAKNAMTIPFVSSFKTGTVIDVIPPFITSVFPLDKASGVDVNAPVRVTFSEPMNAATITPAHFIVSEGTSSIAIFGDLKYVGTNLGTTAIFTPTASLKDSTSYTVTIPIEVTDLSGNGMLTDYIWSFTTGTQAPDTVQPHVLLPTFPDNAQNNVPVFKQVLALFSEKMLASSITPTAFALYDPYGTPVSGQVTASGAMAFFTPAQPLAFLSSYTAVIGSRITDIAGNPLDSNGYTWSFTTEAFANFTITATAGAGGSISPAGAVSVDQNKDQSFTITPAAGYHIADILVDGSSVGVVTTYTFSKVTSDHTINASFAINTYSVTATAGANGTLDGATPSPATVNNGSSASFKFNANAGYHVASVTNTCGGTAYNNTSNSVTTYTYTTPAIIAGCSVTASFAINTYTVTATANANGSLDGTTPSPATVNFGSPVSFKFNANANYHVASVTDTCGGTAYNNTSNTVKTYTYTTPAIFAGCLVTASFANDMYALTVTKSGTGIGIVTADSGTLAWNGNIGTGTYNYGTSVTLNAAADVSSTFTGWSGEGCTGTGTCIVSMTALRNVTANFTIRTFTITPSAGSNGTISPATLQTVNYGSTPTFTFTPANGWYVSAVTVDGSPVALGNSYTFTSVMANHTIAVSFAIGTYKITATAGAGGTITSGGITVPAGTSQDFLVDYNGSRSFTIAPNSGNRVIDILADSVSIFPATSYVFTNVTANHTIQASFTANQAALTVVATPSTVIFGNTSALSTTGGSGTGAVSYSAGASTGCSVAGSTLSVTDASGTCSVTATKAADTNYNLANSSPLSVTLQKANQATLIAVATPSSVAYGSTSALSVTGGSGTGAVTYSAGASSGCSVAGSTLSVTNASGTCSVSATRAADNNYNVATSPALPITLQKANQTTLTVLATPSTVAYGGTSALSTSGGNGTGAVTYDVGASTGCSVSGSILSVISANGTCAVSATRAADNNYNAATSSPLPVTLTKAAQTISFGTAPNLTYGGGNGTVTATATSGLPVTFSSQTTGVCTISGSTVTPVAAGLCTIAANQAGNTNYNAAPQVTQSFTIAAAAQTIGTISFTPSTVAVTGTTTASATATSGLPVTFSSQTPGVCTVSGTNGATVTGVIAGTCTIAANQGGNANYSAAPQVTQTITVAAAAQTISFGTAPSLTYGGGNGTVTATATSGLPVTFSSQTTGVCTISGSTVTPVAAGLCTIAANQAGNANYNAAPQVTQSFTIAAAAQTIGTISFTPSTVAVTGTTTASATAISGLPVTFSSQTPGVCTVSGTNGATVTGVIAGTCTIAANQAGNANYNAAPQVTQNITVAAAAQTISFGTAPSLTYGGGNGTVTATATSGLPVALSSLTTGVCTISGSTVTPVAAGLCTIAANQAGNANYSAAPQVTQNITIAAAAQTIGTISFTPSTVAVTGTTTASATATSGLPITFSSQTPGVCTVSGTNGATVTGVIAGTCTIAANQAGNANYNAAPQVTQNITVAAAAQTIGTISFTPSTVAVTGTTTASATATSGLPITFSSQTPGVCTVSGTNGATVTGVIAGTCTIAANQAGNANYSAAPQVTQNITVAAAAQTISFGTAPSLTYGGGNATVTATATSGLPVAFSSQTTGICTISGSTVTPVAAGLCTIAANQAGNANYSAAPQVTQNITVAAAAQTISFGTAPSLTYGGGNATVTATATSGLPVAFSSQTTGICTISGSTVTPVAAGLCTIAANQAGNANYSAAPQVTQNITVAAAAQTISFGTAPSLTYGGGNATVTATATSGLPVAFSSQTTGICTISGSTVTPVAAGLCTIAANQAGNANYSAAPQVTQNITVAAAAQTISFGTAPSLTYGGGNATVTATATSGLPVAFSSQTTGICTISGSTVTPVAAGLCTIAANQAGNANYSAAPQVTQNITVAAAAQTISFGTAPSLTYGGGNATVTATATSGLPVAFSSQTTGICTISGSTVTPVAAGLCTIAANQAGNANYSAAPQVTQNITVAAVAQTISFGTAPSLTYGGGNATVTATATSGLPVAFSSQTTGICTISGSTVTPVAAGLCTIAANQAGNANYSAAPQVTQNITVAAAAQTISFGTAPSLTYGGGNATVTATATSGLPVAFSSQTTGICTISGSTVTPVAAGLCTIAANQAGNANYSAAPQVTQNITVAAAAQTISFGTAPSLTYGGGNATVTATATSGLPVAFSSQTTGICTISGSTVTPVAAGLCTIAANQAGNANYSAAPQVTQNITVAARPITITADAKTKVFGDPDPALTYTITSGSLVGGDTLTGALTRNPSGEAVGTYAIIQGTLTAGNNYQITYVGAELTITDINPLALIGATQGIGFGSFSAISFLYNNALLRRIFKRRSKKKRATADRFEGQ